MQAAHPETTCHCDEQGFLALVWDDERKQMRFGGHDEDPSLRVRCTDCGTPSHSDAADALQHGPVPEITQDEIDELMAELLSIREEIHREEAMRPWVDPSLMQRRDQLATVETLCDLEREITELEQQGVAVMPTLFMRREELRATVRELLAAAA